MKYQPDHTIQFDGKEIHLLFNVWMQQQFCQRLGIEFEDLQDDINKGAIFKTKNLDKLLLVAAQSFAKFNRTEFAFNDTDAFEWIDAMGGYNGESLATIYLTFVSKISGVPVEELEAKVATSEAAELPSVKKNEETNSLGESSTNLPLERA